MIMGPMGHLRRGSSRWIQPQEGIFLGKLKRCFETSDPVAIKIGGTPRKSMVVGADLMPVSFARHGLKLRPALWSGKVSDGAMGIESGRMRPRRGGNE